MKRLGIWLLALLPIFAQNPGTSVHTLVREDIFAGFLANDKTRFEHGVETLARLEKEHPDKQAVHAWQGAAQVWRAILAHEAKDPASFRKHYDSAVSLCGQAGFDSTQNVGVLIVCGATHMVFADRMPEPERTKSQKFGAEGYRRALTAQTPAYQQFPLHLKGELLAGMAQTSQRTGDQEAMKRYLNEIVTTMPGTVYATRAKRWIDQPQLAAKTTVTCLTCHEPGRLKAKTTAQLRP